ncbi:MAG: hypothetical protein K8L99_19090 [Anaerolineae bacterium]|nr:hypothetical protein [Anaerolineae bacterium]
MPERENLLNDLKAPNDVGVLLLAQMGGVPNELQLIIQTAQYDESVQGLRERPGGYVIRVLSVREHRLSLGLFGSLFFTAEHPILLHHNDPKLDVHFSGTAENLSELVLDVSQAYASTFGPWRELAGDLNRERPLYELLQAEEGRLGTFPRTAAERMVRVLEHHGMTGSLEAAEAERDSVDEHGRSQMWKLLGIGDSYFVALDFVVDRMGKKV